MLVTTLVCGAADGSRWARMMMLGCYPWAGEWTRDNVTGDQPPVGATCRSYFESARCAPTAEGL